MCPQWPWDPELQEPGRVRTVLAVAINSYPLIVILYLRSCGEDNIAHRLSLARLDDRACCRCWLSRSMLLLVVLLLRFEGHSQCNEHTRYGAAL